MKFSAEDLLLAVMGGLVLLFVLNLLARGIARLPKVVRWAWRRTRSRPLGSAGRRLSPTLMLDGLALVTSRLARRPLRIQAFEGPPDVDGPAVSSALSAAMSRIASLRHSGVDTVSAPINAETAVESIAAAVKAAPVGGELAAALVRITANLIAPGELQLSGRVLPDNAGGPGLALTLATTRGQVRERLTIRADELEPTVGSNCNVGEHTDRLTRLATAGAVWTHFQILEGEWHVCKGDLERTLRTASWRSYALMRIGIEDKERQGPHVARALFAKAVDADTGNVAAQFNLAVTELKDDELEQVRMAGMKRLERLHRNLHRRHERQAGDVSESRREDLLIERDPLCYQVSYKRIAAKLNSDVELEASGEERLAQRFPLLPEGASWLAEQTTVTPCRRPCEPIEGSMLTHDDLAELAKHVCELESTLILLKHGDPKRWSAARSKSWKQRADVLAEIEGPMLVLWAMVALRVGDGDGYMWMPETLWAREVYPLARPRREARRRLIDLIREDSLTPAVAVACARGPDVRRSSRTRFNLACWYADIGRLDKALRELELSLESGGTLARRRLRDRQLRHLHGGRLEQEWEKLVARYDPLPEATSPAPRGNNHHPALSRSSAIAQRELGDHFPLP